MSRVKFGLETIRDLPPPSKELVPDLEPIVLSHSSENTGKVSREIFLQFLMKNLIEAKNKFPDLYVWPESDVLTVFRRFVESLEDDTYSRLCHAVKWTCRDLKINSDRKTINAIFKKVG